MLTFNLKKEWFEKIKSGEKTHEYRIMNEYWWKRISKLFAKSAYMINLSSNYEIKAENETPIVKKFHFYEGAKETICLKLGYPKKDNKEKTLYAKVKSLSFPINGKDTDLKINKQVFDIEFELIERGGSNE